ncbi:Transcriptional regulatory protein ZraR [Symmachiella dynata]|uniref:Transcriptional regulatory protein ZraR n=1 Tax=Symmachiella dynata TaxID=2527995 RepID=A0A517ZTD8_9PLAN|nr:sigma-54 dependent transcriptional regulator [Symmachiella dynata]QDU45751.1 Transcriptional regulatory protein ZraR [Symmachiella dynata]
MITRRPQILLLTPDSSFVADVVQEFGDIFNVEVCDSPSAVLAYLAEADPEGLVADLRLIEGGGHAQAAFLEELLGNYGQLNTVLLTEQNAPEPIQRLVACGPAVRLMAYDNIAQLAEYFGHLSETDAPPSAPEKTPAAQVSPTPAKVPGSLSQQFKTKTPAMRRMLVDLEIAAEYDVTVMLIGETGAGKTHLSKLIHEASPRRDEPLMTVACGALPNDLIESELFGHVKGAFTSAHANKDGKFLAAGNGTILLDEIDVLGLEQQVKLLRVIESGQFEPVGSNQTMQSQARIIVASNLELQPLVEQGRFRPDLYYRLNMLKFDILPLRQRTSDVLPLAERFVERFSEKHGVKIDSTDDQLYESLLAYPWPGNVRELEHVIQRAVIYCRDGHLRTEHLPSHITAGIAGPSNEPMADKGRTRAPHLNLPPAESLERQVASTEQEVIEHALLRNSHSRTQTAKDLGISRVTLYNKMKKYGITM